MKKKLLSILLTLSLCLGAMLPLTSCGGGDEGSGGSDKPDSLVIMSEELDGLFNPFFSTTAADGTIVSMTQISMLTMNYVNKEVKVAYGENEPVVTLDYESKYDEDTDKTTYYFVIKNGIKFSDGKPLTIEDVIFNLYVYLDPVYTGSSTMYSTKIEGLANYRSQQFVDEDSDIDEIISSTATTRAKARINELINLFKDTGRIPGSTSYEADYEAMKAAILAHNLNSTYKEAISTKPSTVTNQQLLADYEKTLKLFREELVRDWNASQEAYPTTDAPYKDWKEFDDPVFRFMLYEMPDMITIEYKKLDDGKEDKTVIKAITPNYDLNMTKEQAIDYVYNVKTSQELHVVLQYWATAQELMTEYTATAKEVVLREKLPADGMAVPNIKGINSLGHPTDGEDEAVSEVVVNGTTYKVANEHNEDGTPKNEGEYDVLAITINGVDPKAVWNFSFTVAPQHYYAPGYEVDIANNKFGLEWGSIDFMNNVIRNTKNGDPNNNSVPMGAGAYQATNAKNESNPTMDEFHKNDVVYFKANNNFFFATPKIDKVRYQVVGASNAITALESGVVHFISPQYTQYNAQRLNSLASSGIATASTDQLGYGYIGVSAKYVPDINLRRAIMTAMNTELALEYYLTGTAENIYFPMSTVSWAYPKDELGYITDNGQLFPKIPFDEEAAKKQILQYMSDAGVSANSPDLTLKFTIAGANVSDHPTYAVFQKAAKLLNECGWNITVLADSQALTKLSTGSLAVWAAAWGSTVDPDLYQVYHKNSTATSTLAWGYDAIKSNPNSEEAGILDELSKLIDDAREIDNQKRRAEIYHEALKLIMELAIELPVYQRDVLYAYNSKVIKTSSLPAEINPYSTPLDRIWEIEFAA